MCGRAEVYVISLPQKVFFQFLAVFTCMCSSGGRGWMSDSDDSGVTWMEVTSDAELRCRCVLFLKTAFKNGRGQACPSIT